MAGWDDFGGDWDWLNDADVGDTGSILDDFASGADDVFYLDSETGDIVSAADAQALSADVPNVPGGPTGTSLSDQLRSREGSPTTWTPGSEPFDLNAMADPSASIASAGGGMDWLKALGQGLSAAKGLLGGGSGQGGLAGLTQPGGGGGSVSGLPGLMAGGSPQVGGVGAPDITRVGAWGQPDLSRPDIASLGGLLGRAEMSQPEFVGGARMQDPISAALTHLQPADLLRLGFQAPIDPGPAPRPFSPLVIPTTPPGGGGTAAGGPRMSGLQRLVQERFG